MILQLYVAVKSYFGTFNNFILKKNQIGNKTIRLAYRTISKIDAISALSPFSSSSISQLTAPLNHRSGNGGFVLGPPQATRYPQRCVLRRSTHVCPKGEPVPVTNVQANYDFHARVN